jgi:hypothetical protein
MLAFASGAFTQSSATISEGQAREWAAYAAEKAAGDPKVLDPFSMGVTLHRSDALDVTVIGPVSDFQLAVSEAVRKMTPIEKVPWPCGASIYVLPSRIDSPDIERVLVKRGTTIVAPVANSLVSQQMTTRAGVAVTLHSGSVCYPPSVFAAGQSVTVTAIPVAGDNIIKVLEDADLMMII